MPKNRPPEKSVISRAGNVFRGAILFGVFLLSFAGVCVAIRAAIPFPQIPTLHQKLERFRKDAAEINILFMGSSRVFHQIDPVQFDETLAAQNIPVRSFNAGMDGALMPEDGFILEQFLADRPPNLQWIFIELNTFGLGSEQHRTIRTRYWHNWTRTSLVCRDLLGNIRFTRKEWVSGQWLKNVGGIGLHLMLFGERFVNLGRANDLWKMERLGEPAWKNGYSAHDQPSTPAQHAIYETKFSEYVKNPARKTLLTPVAQENVDAMVATIRKAGAKPIFLVSTSVTALKFYPLRNDGIPVFDFTDHLQYPELFSPEHRLDAGHLNHVGAKLYTRLLAESFAALTKMEGPTTSN